MQLLFFRILVILSLLTYSISSFSQDFEVGSDNPKINYLELGFNIANAQGFYKKNVAETLLGFDLGYLRQLKSDKPLFWGLNTYYFRINSASATIEEVLDFSFVQFNYTTTNNLLGFLGKMRFYPDLRLGKMEFYMEAQLGYKWLYTMTTKTLVDDSSSSDSNFEKGSLSLTYGVSCGFNYHIKDQLYLNFRANYLPGISTSYYTKNDQNNIVESTIDRFDLTNSTTNIIKWDLGITFWPNFEK